MHEEESLEEEEILQEDSWVVISAFFDEKGLVRQVWKGLSLCALCWHMH